MLWDEAPQKSHIPQIYFIPFDSSIIRLTYNYKMKGKNWIDFLSVMDFSVALHIDAYKLFYASMAIVLYGIISHIHVNFWKQTIRFLFYLFIFFISFGAERKNKPAVSEKPVHMIFIRQ